MMPVARAGFDNVSGGPILTGALNVFINLAPVAQLGSAVGSHPPCCCPPFCLCQEHCATTIVTGSPTVFVNLIPAARVGDIAACGHPVTSGAFNVFFG